MIFDLINLAFSCTNWPLLLTTVAGVFVGLPLVLLVLYAVGIQHERPALRRGLANQILWLVLAGVAWIALVVDVLLNWTVLCIYFWEWPRRRPQVHKTEWTLTERLERLVLATGWRSTLARGVAHLLNWFSPTHDHIKNVLE